MVAVQKSSSRKRDSNLLQCLKALFWASVICFSVWRLGILATSPIKSHSSSKEVIIQQEEIRFTACPYTSLQDLTDAELHPVAGERHMVTPPADTNLTLVCCHTTAGPWNIVVHHAWAPLGAARFVEMVKTDYFNQQQVPLMRCIANFLCQFGLAGTASKQFAQSLLDDPQWLPKGKEHRQNSAGVKRFAIGYLAYAGAGPDTRSNQLFVALHNDAHLAGGSPWEVPWGELVGPHSFETLSKIYTGYGEKGPSQAKLHQASYLELVQSEFPKLDLIESCHVVEERLL